MLVLTRKANDAIMLFWEGAPAEGEAAAVSIRILEVSGETVRIGIEAPAAVRVLREEVWLATRANRAAAESPPPATLPAAPGGRPVSGSHPLSPHPRKPKPVPPEKPGSR